MGGLVRPLQRPSRVWSSAPGRLSVWTQSASSVELWIIPHTLSVSKAHWSSRVRGPAGGREISSLVERNGISSLVE